MGMPSIGIYSYELFNFFGVENILRIGSAGALRKDVQMRDIVIGMGASTDSGFAQQFRLCGNLAPLADYRLLRTAADVCEERKIAHHVGNLYSTDVFYNDDFSVNARWGEMGALAVEMEAAALYINAAKAGKRALAICTVSDHLLNGEALSSEERQCGFRDMMEVALEVAVRMEKAPKIS
jgi:purine-nucleoside phosphorylase